MVNIKNNGEGLTIKNFTDSASKTNDNHIYFIDSHEVNVTNTDVSSSLIRFYINEFFNQYPYMFNIHILESHNDSSISFGFFGIDNFSSVYSKYSPNSNKGSTFKVKCLVSDDCLVDVYSYDGSVVQSGVRVFFNNPSLKLTFFIEMNKVGDSVLFEDLTRVGVSSSNNTNSTNTTNSSNTTNTTNSTNSTNSTNTTNSTNNTNTTNSTNSTNTTNSTNSTNSTNTTNSTNNTNSTNTTNGNGNGNGNGNKPKTTNGNGNGNGNKPKTTNGNGNGKK
jgi:hypothetical protein